MPVLAKAHSIKTVKSAKGRKNSGDKVMLQIPATAADVKEIATGVVLLDGGLPLEPIDTNELFCFCRLPETVDMIACDDCEEWFHASCFDIKLVS